MIFMTRKTYKLVFINISEVVQVSLKSKCCLVTSLSLPEPGSEAGWEYDFDSEVNIITILYYVSKSPATKREGVIEMSFVCLSVNNIFISASYRPYRLKDFHESWLKCQAY